MSRIPLQMTFRWVLAAAFAVTAALGSHAVPSLTPLLAVCVAVALYNGTLALPRWRGAPPAWLTLALLFLDQVAFTAYLHYSGDIENPLRFAYAMTAAAAAIILSTRWGLLLAVSSMALFSLLMFGTWVDSCPLHFRHFHLGFLDLSVHDAIDPDLSPHRMNFLNEQIFRLGIVTFGAAWGFGVLARRLKARETELKVSYERMRLLLNILPVGVFLFSREKDILFANAPAREYAGAWRAGKVDDLDPALGVKERLSRFQGPVEEFEVAYGGRSLILILARTSPDGPVALVVRDRTERQRLMAEIIHRSKMADLGLLAAGIAHEIGNPLSSMSATIELLEMKNAPPEILDRLGRLKSHIDRIGRIVQDIRSFSRPSAGACSRVSPGALQSEALQIFRLHEKSRHVTVETVPSEGVPAIEVVPDQIVQILLNLLINAADASEPGGKIAFQSVYDEGMVKISVADHGAGMDEEAKSHLFAPFFTTKEPGKGTGLGLFVSESIARAHGGSIDVESAPGRGSTFTLRLPRAKGD